MDATTLEKYRLMLDALESELRDEIEKGRLESAPVQLDGSMGRVSRGDAMQVQQLALEMQRRRDERLLRVQAARQRMRSGTYGLCGRCRRAIDEARLEAFPDVVLCVQCASNRPAR